MQPCALVLEEAFPQWIELLTHLVEGERPELLQPSEPHQLVERIKSESPFPRKPYRERPPVSQRLLLFVPALPRFLHPFMRGSCSGLPRLSPQYDCGVPRASVRGTVLQLFVVLPVLLLVDDGPVQLHRLLFLALFTAAAVEPLLGVIVAPQLLPPP